MTSESTGLHYIFAAGTGILPFLDLFDYLLEDSIEDKAKGKSLFDNGFKLHVFASFSSIKDFIGLEICEKLSQLCKAKGLSEAFQLTVKAGDAHHNDLYHVTDSKFDKRFIEKNVKRESERAFVCGPPEFNELIPGQLEELGLSRKNIILV